MFAKKSPRSGRALGLKKKPESSTLPEDEVKLKPFMNIRPGVYLACFYGAALLLVLFFVLFYPGISNPGLVVSVKSEPWGAAVLVDGAYMDTAPCEFFVSDGRRRIELTLPGFNPVHLEKDIAGRIFASAIFPAKIEIREKLETKDPAAAFIGDAAEYAAWTFAGEPSAAYQIPLSLSESVYRLGPAASDPALRKSMEETLAASVRFAATRAGLRDLVRAKTLLDNNGLSPSPLSLLASIEDMIGFLNDNPGTAAWLAATLGADAGKILAASSWYGESARAAQDTPPLPPQSGGRIQAGLLTFKMIPATPLQGAFPYSFYISETVISAAAWEAFLDKRPQWKPENTETLMGEGLVKEDYLKTAESPAAPAEGVSGISWYAARAFCEWLSSSLPPQLASWELRLPTEAEWEYAAKTGALDPPQSPDSAKSAGYGLFWEWCEDPFAPLSFISVSLPAAQALGSPERSLRGGAWISPAGSVGPETRASLPPSFCSPFVSFRPVIAPKRD